eukprot:g33412.t1
MCIQCNGEIIGQRKGVPSVAPIARKYLYVGKSCWSERDMFHGSVQQLKVYNGQIVDWHEVVAATLGWVNTGMGDLRMDRDLPARGRPRVHGADRFFRTESKQDRSFDASGQIDSGYFVAALLRCCYGIVQVSASSKAEAEMASRTPCESGSAVARCRGAAFSALHARRVEE